MSRMTIREHSEWILTDGMAPITTAELGWSANDQQVYVLTYKERRFLPSLTHTDKHQTQTNTARWLKFGSVGMLPVPVHSEAIIFRATPTAELGLYYRLTRKVIPADIVGTQECGLMRVRNNRLQHFFVMERDAYNVDLVLDELRILDGLAG
jgi:hypothetical protein